MVVSRKALLVLGLIVVLVFAATACNLQGSKQSSNRGPGDSPQDSSAKQGTANQKPAETPLFVSIISVISPVSPGGIPTTLFARTKPGAICNIQVGYKGGPNEAKALTQKQAEPNGLVSWTWTVDPSVALGTYPITVTAMESNGGSKTASTRDTLEIKSAEQCNS